MPSWCLCSIIALLPAVLFAAMAFERRWMNEDAFINLRIARNILEGHGFVYNVGERVEAGTSPLWIFFVTLLGLFGIRLEHAAVYGGWVLSIAALLLVQHAALIRTATVDSALATLRSGLVLPLGAGVFSVLPPAWDYAASGLETGLITSWLAGSYLLLVRLAVQKPRDRRDEVAQQQRPPRPWSWHLTAVLLGLGPLIRPELTLYTFGFLVALSVGFCLQTMPTIRARLRALVLLLLSALTLPFAYQIFRMGYFAVLTPNTALAKEAFLARWRQGYYYAENFFDLYYLVIPLLAVLLVWLQSVREAWRARAWMLLSTLLAPTACSLLHGLYVTRLGGDFMHGRMFLPVLFGFLLPVAMIPLRKKGSSRKGATARVVVCCIALAWMLFCGVSLRVGRDNVHGIGDERGWHARLAGKRNPVGLEDYEDFPFHQQGVHLRRSAGRRCENGRLPQRAGEQSDCIRTLLVPRSFEHVPLILAKYPLGGSAPPQVAMATSLAAIGMTPYLLGSAVHVVDVQGLADPLAARIKLEKRGRPGHEKRLSNAWVVARFTDYAVGEPAEVTAARNTLGCGALAELHDAVAEPLTWDRFFRNLRRCWQLQRLRFSPHPLQAQQQLCGTPPPYQALAGGPGGDPRSWHCPAGFALSQLSGSVSATEKAISQVIPLCKRLRQRGTEVGFGYRRSLGPRIGKWSADRFTLSCPPGQLPVGFHGHSKRLIRRVGLVCAVVQRAEGRGHTGPASHSEDAGRGQGDEFELLCPQGNVIVGVVGRAGDLVDAIGVVCGAVEPEP